MPKMVYISGALTDMTEEERAKLRHFYEAIGKLCEEFKFETYLPHVYGDPKLVAHLSPAEIDRIDRLAVTQSYLVVAYVGIASTGTGIEIELAHHANKPVILLYERAKLDQRLVSRLVRGNPAVSQHIAFADFDDALRQLRGALETFCDRIAGETLPPPLSHH